jgi:hypothetical protein
MNKAQILAFLKSTATADPLTDVITLAIKRIKESKSIVIGGTDTEQARLHEAEHYQKIYEARLRLKRSRGAEPYPGLVETVNALQRQKGKLKLFHVQTDSDGIVFWVNEDAQIAGCIVGKRSGPTVSS